MTTIGSYTVRARTWPLVLAASPLFVFAGFAAHLKLRAAIGSAGLGLAVVFLGSQLARDAGKKLEKGLWNDWGGPPTRRRLTFGGALSDSDVLRAHQAVSAATGLLLPTRDEQARDPVAAAEAYDHAVLRLRELTRDRSRFPLVFSENVNYGFRRNLLALKRLGIALATITLVAGAVLAGLAGNGLSTRLLSYGIPAAWSLLALFAYWRFITKDWVRVVADAYADRLIGSAEMLASAPAP